MVAIAERPIQTEEEQMEQRHNITIRMGGESGEGVKSTGELFSQVAARAGFRVLTFQTYPAEIKGGHSVYQVRLSAEDLYTEGASLDILLAFNQEGYDKSYEELTDNGLLLYDDGAVSSFHYAQGNRRHLALPMTKIAKGQLKFELGKNVVAVGMLAALFGMDVEPINRLLTEKFLRKGEEVVAKNKEAFQLGFQYIEENYAERSAYYLKPGTIEEDAIIVSGNQFLSMGCIAAGCTHLFGYPITPASDIMEFLAAELPKVGGAVIQAEDEIASMGMVLGASYTGKRAMTSTSGPGLSLMVEMMGLSGMAELPAVIADVQRTGPSTGMPTKQEQGDLNMAVYAGHGEIPRVVLAPTDVTDCFWRAIDAFNFAERYQLPVILLSDTTLAVRTQSVHRPDLSKVKLIPRVLYNPEASANATIGRNGEHEASPTLQNGQREANLNALNDGEGDDVDVDIAASRGFELYQRYAMTEDGVSPMSLPGMPGGQYTSSGLEHNEFSRPRYDVINHTKMTDKRHRKLEYAAKEAPEAFRAGDPAAEIGIIAWGSTTGVAYEAMLEAKKHGVALDVIAPRMLWPIPTQQLDDFIASKRVIIIPEVNFSGQYANLLNTHYHREFVRVNVYGGAPLKSSQLLARIMEYVERS